MMPAVPTIGVTTTGVAPTPAAASPLLAVAMPGFSALLASAAATPSIVMAPVFPMVTPLPVAAGLPPQRLPPPDAVLASALPPAEPDMPSAPIDDDRLATAKVAVSVTLGPLFTASDLTGQPRLAAPSAPDGPTGTTQARTDDDQSVTDAALPEDVPAPPAPAMPIVAATLPPAPRPVRHDDAVLPAFREAQGVRLSAPMVAVPPTLVAARMAPALSAVPPPVTPASRVDRATPVAGAEAGSPAAPRHADGGDLMTTAAPPAVLSARSDPMVMAAMPSAASAAATALSATMLSVPARPSSSSPPAAAPHPVGFAVPSLAVAARPIGSLRLPRALPDSDDRAGVLTIATGAAVHRPFEVMRAEPQAVTAPRLTAAIAPEPVAATDIAISSDRLGAVRIGIDGAPGDLRVSLGLSPAAAVIVAADTPRLLADLAAGGVRLQSLDLSGGGFAGGQGGSQGTSQGAPQPRSGAIPRVERPAEPNSVIPVRLRTADRYA